MIIIIVLKLSLGVDPVQGSSHEWGWLLTQVNVRIKVVIIILLKSNSRVDPVQGTGHVSGRSTWNKSGYYHGFNTWFGG